MTAKQVVATRLPTSFGEFKLYLFENSHDDKDHLALVMGDVEGAENVLARVHSECLTGDVLGSQRCDCGEQLRQGLARIADEGCGVLLYMRQEGRGIGLVEKLRAYNLQDEGYDTVDANLVLGHQADSRDYSISAAMLSNLGVKSIRLLTNNPSKIDKLRMLGVTVLAREPLKSTMNANNERYLRTKVTRMNHLLDLPAIRSELDDPDVDPD
ncbi:MAG: GTP cyclohydrolase II [Anaerolineae bacterium]|nr:MAG: GTP cyclohydrolase II [Anaerolineae bacterium]